MSYQPSTRSSGPSPKTVSRAARPTGVRRRRPSAKKISTVWKGGPTMEPATKLAGKTIVLSDVDGTLVKSSLVLESAVEVHRDGRAFLGDAPERWLADMKNESLIRELAETYREALVGKSMAFVKAEATITRLLADDENFYATLKRLVKHQEDGHEVVLITGSPDFLVKPFAEKFGFKYFASTYHVDDNGCFTGEIELMAGAVAKQAVIDSLGLENYSMVIGLGDTASDAPLLAASHQSVLVAPTEETLEVLRAKGIRIDELVFE